MHSRYAAGTQPARIRNTAVTLPSLLHRGCTATAGRGQAGIVFLALIVSTVYSCRFLTVLLLEKPILLREQVLACVHACVRVRACGACAHVVHVSE